MYRPLFCRQVFEKSSPQPQEWDDEYFCQYKEQMDLKRKRQLRLLTHVGFLRQNGLILSEVFYIWKEARIKKKNTS